MSTPQIPLYVGDVPNRATDSATEFADNADDMVSYIADIADNYNSLAEFVNNAAELTQSAGNYKGYWSDLSGSYSAGDGVGHDGHTWLLLVPLVSIQSSEPSDTNTDWQRMRSGDVNFVKIESSSTYTPSVGVKSIEITLVGGGGASGGVPALVIGEAACSLGGGGGQTVIARLSDIASSYFFRIGDGGAAGAAGSNDGGGGSNTYVRDNDTSIVLWTAYGGSGGLAGSVYTGYNIDYLGGTGGRLGGDTETINIAGDDATGAIVLNGYVTQTSYGGRSFVSGVSAYGDASDDSAYGRGASGWPSSAGDVNKAAHAGNSGANGIAIIKEFF